MDPVLSGWHGAAVLSIAAALCFAGYVLAALWLGRPRRAAAPSERRKFRVSLFLLYALGASFGAGLTQHDLWPFVAWPLVAADLPEVVTEPRVVAVDRRGVEHDIDYRVWWPLSFDEYSSWMKADFLALDAGARDRLAREMVATVESGRLRARQGGGVGHFGRFLGPFHAPLFLLHPAIWSVPTDVPADTIVGLRFYQETWNLEKRARGSGVVRRRLQYAYPKAP